MDSPNLVLCHNTATAKDFIIRVGKKGQKAQRWLALYSFHLNYSLDISLDIAFEIPICWISKNQFGTYMFNHCGLGASDCQLAIGVGGLLLMPSGQEFCFPFRGKTRF